jgi:minimal PKS ketosynthase (KS/KS alpha)
MASRTVITGIGIMSPAGAGSGAYWEAICRGTSLVSSLTHCEFNESGCAKVAAEIGAFELGSITRSKLKKYADRSAGFALAAANECIADAGLSEQQRRALDVLVGSCGSAIEWGENQLRRISQRPLKSLHPHASVIGYPGNLVGILTIVLGIHGRGIVFSDLDCSGLDALGFALHLIGSGESERVMVGATEAPLTPMVFHVLNGAGLLAREGAEAAIASRPFDAARNGLVLGEGAVALIIEDRDAALRRGARIYSEILSYAASWDSSPSWCSAESPDGNTAITEALERAGVSSREIDYVSASACSSPELDRHEADLLTMSLDGAATTVPVSSVKGVIGEPLSASGLLQTATCALALTKKTLPPTANLVQPEPGCRLNLIRAATPAEPAVTLQTSCSVLRMRSTAVVQAAA